MTRSVYLDHNATSPLDPRVAEAMSASSEIVRGNPSSPHRSGRQARQLLEEAREGIADILGAEQHSARRDRVIFTSGATEANNLALWGLIGQHQRPLAISTTEHPSCLEVGRELQRRGHPVHWLPVATDGQLLRGQALQMLEQLSGPQSPAVVCVIWGNNETGVINPIREISADCLERQALLHTDAVQVAGRLPIDFAGTGTATLSLSAHKLNGPTGVGALLVRHDVQLLPLQWGGPQQDGLRPGTESVPLAVGLHVALRCWHHDQLARMARIEQLRDRFEHHLLTAGLGIEVNGTAKRLPHVSNLSFVGLDRQVLLMALDLAGVECSTGSACSSGSTEPSHVLEAMGLPSDRVSSSLRFSLGTTTEEADIELAISRIIKAVSELRARKLQANSDFAARDPRRKPV